MEDEGVDEEEDSTGKGVGEEICLGRGFFEGSGVSGVVKEAIGEEGAGDCSCDELDGKRWLTGARGKTFAREAELDRAENSGSGGDSREKASRGSARIEVWQDFLHASE
ncbi:hypothetical protein Taro_003961, partial [Colocasia esculenta]|nr:hypothetical protein [Colocasia esculenta]